MYTNCKLLWEMSRTGMVGLCHPNWLFEKSLAAGVKGTSKWLYDQAWLSAFHSMDSWQSPI